MWNPFHPKPAPPAYGAGKDLPERKAFFLSQLLFFWLDPLLKVGFSRPLEQDDLWHLPPDRATHRLTDKLEAAFYARCPPSQRPPAFQDSTDSLSSSSEREDNASDKNTRKEEGKPDVKADQKYDSSLFKTIHSVYFTRLWVAGILNFAAEILKTTTPLVNKVLLTWLAESYAFYRTTPEERSTFGISNNPPRGVGYGVGIAFALFVMQEGASLMTNHYMQLSMSVGLSVRASVIGSVFRKALRLSSKARSKHTPGEIMTLISTDAERLNHFAMYAHNLWITPIQIILGVALLIWTLGYSALVGLGVILFGMPIQGIFAMIIYKQRAKEVKFTDSRVRLTSEVLQGIRLLKFYAWEEFYTEKIASFRKGELKAIKNSLIAQSALLACVSFIPLVAAILSFITYSLSGHNLTVPIIFTSLQFFNVIRAPLIILPAVLSALGTSKVALERTCDFLTAEERFDAPTIDYELKEAVRIADGHFVWDVAPAAENGEGKDKDSKDTAKEDKKPGDNTKDKKKKTDSKGPPESILPTTAPVESEKPETEKENEKEPFRLKSINMKVAKGSFVAIVGRVGSGKSSVLQAMLGEMKKTQGQVLFGGSLAYAPQTPWIRNATMRENIVGEDKNEQRLNEVLNACSLTHDIDLLQHGLDTDIGEKGINLSGGQKARVSLARAVYSSADIALLDDPLSAVDAYVGKQILENCLLSGPLANRTRILVTHALHALPKVDYVYVVEDGEIKEEGSYSYLIENGPIFSRLIQEFGQKDNEVQRMKVATTEETSLSKDLQTAKTDVLMQDEERSTGAVTWGTYADYFRHAGSLAWAPIILILLTLSQCSEVGSNLLLGFWTSLSIRGFSQGDYMGLYAGFGAAQAVFTFLLSYVIAIIGLKASFSMFRTSLNSVLKSPVSFFDTTPMGRILSRLSKDQDTLDTYLPFAMQQLLVIVASVLGTVGLVFYILPLLGVIFAPMAILYYLMSMFYRRTSVEIKRLDSLSRSAFYSAYSETLTGLSTVRAYREEDKAIHNAEEKLDKENRAYYITLALQRWLAIRLDLFANALILGIGLAASTHRTTVNPAKIGVVLSYSLSIAETFSQLINTFAQNEQNMNAAERLLVYTKLAPEIDSDKQNDPTEAWPSKGEIQFKDVDFAYRDGLPLVLKGVSFHINSGEKVGVVGRTGSGKSSLIQALFRIVNVKRGSIELDGRNIRDISLEKLRRGIALVPQDSTLFLGTLRDNIDPLHTCTDAELISAMKRSCLVPSESGGDATSVDKYNLDTTVGDEGSNFSAGEKQLIALCRALVKNSRIIVLDEATSNVDPETDANLQRTIQNEFGDSTMLCVAHRLNTIAHYDRVLVMDDGKVAEIGPVLELFDNPDSIFRSLCDEAGLRREDIVRIRSTHGC